MAQAEERNTSTSSQILITLQAPEVLEPQVLVKEVAKEKPESQSIKKKLKKLFSKINLTAKITEEAKDINNVKASFDARNLAYRNNFINY